MKGKGDNKYKEKFIRKFTKLLEKKDLSYREAGSLLGEDHTKIYRWCNGTGEPTVSELNKILDVFSLPDNYFR